MRLEMMRGLEGHVKDVGKSLQAGGGCEHICASKRSIPSHLWASVVLSERGTVFNIFRLYKLMDLSAGSFIHVIQAHIPTLVCLSKCACFGEGTASFLSSRVEL